MADGVGDNKPNLFNPKRQNGGNTKDKETKSLVNYPTPSQKDWKPPARTGGRCICCCWQQNVGQLVMFFFVYDGFFVDDGFFVGDGFFVDDGLFFYDGSLLKMDFLLMTALFRNSSDLGEGPFPYADDSADEWVPGCWGLMRMI